MDNEISDRELAEYIAEHKKELLKRNLRGAGRESEQLSPVDSVYNRSLHRVLEMSESEIREFWPTFNKARENHLQTIDQDNIFQILVGIRMQVPSK
jgi:hypothetical protein